MKCINRKKWGIAALCTTLTLITGCGTGKLVAPYENNDSMFQSGIAGMAQDLCVTNTDVIPEGLESVGGTAALFDVSNKNVLYASNVHEKRYPASITKIMTALLFLESYQGDFSDVITIDSNVYVDEWDAQMCGYKKGDKVSLDQLFHGLMMYSGNDAALILAKYVSGDVNTFVERMNQRAYELGATRTHFVNPHGLNDENHYTTAYDLYLIFQKAMQYDKFREVIHESSYSGTYYTADGSVQKVNWKSTNQYMSGKKETPENVTIIGGKTGTTNAAGACLILLSQNQKGEEFVSVVLQGDDRDQLYENMSILLGKINN